MIYVIWLLYQRIRMMVCFARLEPVLKTLVNRPVLHLFVTAKYAPAFA